MNAIAWFAAVVLLTAAMSSTSAGQQVPQLDTVRVASRSGDLAAASTRTVEVIAGDEIDRRPGHDLLEKLANSLGIDVFGRSPAQADLSIRGSSFSQVVILVDGTRVSDVQSGHYNLDLAVPMASIDRIEILRGGGSAVYGADAIGGVVNIVTKGAAKGTSALSAAAHGGSFGTAGGSLSLAGDAGSTGLRLTTDVDRSDGHRSGTDYRLVQSRVAASRRALGGAVIADAAIGIRDFGAADFYGPYPSYEDTRTSTATLGYEHPLGELWHMQATVDTRRHSDLYTLIKTDPTVYQNRHVSHQDGGRIVASGRWRRLSSAVGGEVFNASLVSERLGNHAEIREAAFTEATIGDGAKPTLNLGAREDWSSRTGRFFSPSVAASAPLIGAMSLRASVNRGFRAPSWTESYYTDPSNVANPDLQSETFTMGEVGMRALPKWGRLDLAVFGRHGNQLIDWTKPVNATPTTPWRATNLESATFRGLEAEVTLADLLGMEWRARGSGIAFNSTGADTLVGKYALSPITETLGLDLTSRTYFGTTCTASIGRARRANEALHWQADLRAARHVKDVDVRIDALNLTNADYLDASRRPVAGRSLTISLAMKR